LATALAAVSCELAIGDIPDKRTDSTTGGGGGSTGASTSTTGGAGTTPCCDCDGDGVNGPQCAMMPPVDCDDMNRDVHPNQTMFFDKPADMNRGYDYDCSNAIEREFGSVDCNALLGVMCNTMTEAFLGTTPPACGQPGKWGKCVLSGGVNCVEDVKDTSRVVRCH
jgi:hypothetical protein